MVSIALVSCTVVIKVIFIHTTCMNGEADYCHLVSMYAYMHLVFKELKVWHGDKHMGVSIAGGGGGGGGGEGRKKDLISIFR